MLSKQEIKKNSISDPRAVTDLLYVLFASGKNRNKIKKGNDAHKICLILKHSGRGDIVDMYNMFAGTTYAQ